MAKALERRIRERTNRGDFGPNSVGAFDQYEPEYARRHGKPIAPVNLRLNGNLMGGMEGKVSFPSGDNMALGMTFSSERSRRIAEYLQFFGVRSRRGLKKREFLYATESDIQEMMNIAETVLGIRINRGSTRR